jgi:hypothetical protein
MNATARKTADEPTARLTTAGRGYLDDVAQQVDDLPPGDREELLSDVIDAVAGLDDLDAVDADRLRARLGDPTEFAAELRRSAGLPERVDAAPDASAGVAHHLRQLADAAARPLRFAGREFESAWWLLRGLAVAVVIALVLGLHQGPALLLLVLVVGASVVVGWRMRDRPVDGRTWLWRGIGTAVAGLVVFFAGASLLDRPTWDEAGMRFEGNYAPYVGDAGVSAETPPAGQLFSANGPIANLYAFDERGERLTNVRLFDDNGYPVDLGYGPGVDPLRVFARSTSDEPLLNVFPIRYAESAGGEVADPDAGWPESPGPLRGVARDVEPAEVEAPPATRAARAGTQRRSGATAPSPTAPNRGTRGR